MCGAALQTFVRFGIKRRAKTAMYVLHLILISYFKDCMVYFVIILIMCQMLYGVVIIREIGLRDMAITHTSLILLKIDYFFLSQVNYILLGGCFSLVKSICILRNSLHPSVFPPSYSKSTRKLLSMPLIKATLHASSIIQ